jgi:hypothetical protein
VHESVDFVDQNALNLTNEQLYIHKFFQELYPRTPVKRGKEKGGEEKGRRGRRRVGNEGYRTGRGRGWDKKKRERKEGGEGEKHTPGFLQHPQFELSRNKPDFDPRRVGYMLVSGPVVKCQLTRISTVNNKIQ